MPLYQKSSVFLCCTLCIVFLCCKGNSYVQQPPKKLTADNNGNIISINNGTVFNLTLDNNVDGGYHFDSVIYNKDLLQLIEHTAMPPRAHSGLGNHGRDTWRFVAIKNGRSVLKLTASRPWNHGDILNVFTSIILIK